MDDPVPNLAPTQDEIEGLKREVAELRKALNDKQQPKLSTLAQDQSFIEDMARFASGVLSEAQVRHKYHLFDESTWEQLGNDDALVERIELEKTRRLRSGTTKRELAQNHIVRAPEILNEIMSDPRSNARHKVDAIKTLDTLADNGPRAAPDAERFTIIIDLSAAGEEKKIVINTNPNDNNDTIDGETIDVTPAMITANKREENGGGEPL